MGRFSRYIAIGMRFSLLHIVAICGTTLNCFGEDDPVKTPDRNSATAGQPKVHVKDRKTLEASLNELEFQFTASEEVARNAARDYRDEAVRKSPDAKELAKRKQALEVAVSTSFKNQVLLEKTRLEIAERDLIDQQVKHTRRESLAEKIIARRVADLMYGEDLEWLIARKTVDIGISPETGESQGVPAKDPEPAAKNPLPNFATPQELLDFLEKASGHDEITRHSRTIAELMDQDEQNRLAGVCLRTASLVRSASRLAQGFSALSPDGQNAQLIRVGRELETLVQEARLSKPPRKAQAAYESISASDISIFQLMLNAQPIDTPTPTVAADAYSAKLRKAAGVLKDPIHFTMDFVTLMSEFESSDEKKEPARVKKPAEWDITVEGDRAVVIDRSGASYTPGVTLATNRIELVKTGDTWKISNMIPDEVIIDLQQGMRAGKSSDTPDVPAK